MSSVDVGTAFIRVLPDVSGFRAALEAQVTAITKTTAATVRVTPVMNAAAAATGSVAGASGAAAAANEQLAASSVAATVGTESLAAAQTVAADTSAREAAAALAVSRALAAQTAAEQALTAAIAENASAAKVQQLTTRASLAAQATSVAQLRQTELAGKKAGQGFLSASRESKILQGSIVGLSRVTPVAVFGLGVAGTAAIAAGLAFKSAVGSAAEFEKQLNTFQAVTGATADQIEAVRKESLALGGDTSLAAQSAGDAAVAMTELAKAGLSVKDSLAAARGVLELAGAAEIGAGEAARIVATELNAFKLSGDQATRVVDLLASASIAAQGDMTDFAAAFQQVSAVANQSGLSVEQTTAALTQLAKAGIQGSDAGTSLRTFLLRLIPTTKQAGEFTRALGVQLDSTKTEGEQLSSVIDQYRSALQALTPVQRTNVLNQIFGQDAIRAASVLTSQNADALNQQIEALNQQGIAAELNAAKAKGLSGAFAGLKSNLETAGVQLGSLVDGPLEKLVRGMSTGVEEATNLVEALGKIPAAVEELGNLPPVKITIDFVTTVNDKVEDFVKSIPGEKQANDAANKALDIAGKTPIPSNIPFLVKDLLDRFKTPQKIAPVDLNPGQANDQFGIGNLVKSANDVRSKQFLDTFGKAADLAKKNNPRLRKEIQALIDKSNGDSASALKDLTVDIPVGLQQSAVDSLISGNLKAQVAADDGILAFLTKKRAAAAEGSKKFLAISQQIQQFTSDRKGALAAIEQAQKAITDQRKQDADARQKLFETALGNQQTRLEIAAEDAGNRGAAEKRLIAFLAREANDARLTTAQQLAFTKELKAERKKQTAVIVSAAKDEIDRKKALLDLRVQQAELTPGISDEKKRLNDEIAFLREQQKNTKALSKEWIAYESEITGLKSRIKNLTSQDGGFSLQDLFKEAVDQFNTFGSNIGGRNGVLSPQDARASLGKNIMDTVQTNLLTEAEQQTLYLSQILDAIQNPGSMSYSPARKRELVSAAGNFGGWRAAQEAANNLYGAG